MKKIFLILGAGLLALIGIMGIVLGLYLGPIVKIGMEQVGPQIVQVPIKVDAVDLSLLTGLAQVKGFVLGNPSGYKTSQAISVGAVVLSVAPFSVLSDKILVHSIHVESPEITFEGGFRSSNLSKILQNVNAIAQNGGPAPSNNGPGSYNKPAPKIEVDDFLITGAKVHVNLSGLVSQVIDLPDIHLTDLGKSSNGLTPTELTRTIFSAISKDTINVVTSSVNGIVQGVQKIGKFTGKSVIGNVSKIADTFGGLFGK